MADRNWLRDEPISDPEELKRSIDPNTTSLETALVGFSRHCRSDTINPLCTEVWIQFFPWVTNDENIHQVCETLRTTCDRFPSIVPALCKHLYRYPDDESVWSLGMSLLGDEPPGEALIRDLCRRAKSKARAATFIRRIRNDWGQNVSVGHFIASSMEATSMLGRVYVRELAQTDPTCLDLAVVIGIEALYTRVRKWFQSDTFPWELLKEALPNLMSSCSSELVMFALRMFVEAARLTSASLDFRLIDFAVELITSLSHETRSKFFEPLMQLYRQASFLIDDEDGDTEPSKRLLELVHQTLLRTIRSHSIQGLDACTRLIHEKVLHGTCEDEAVVGDRCRLLVALTSDVSEILVLIRRLFFASFGIESARDIERGLLLSCEVVGGLPPDEQRLLTDDVWRVLLPTTRRIVDPRVGSAGIAFCYTINRGDHDIFSRFKTLMSNTGLVQMESSYRLASRRYETSLIYQSEESSTSSRRMVFAACYYVKHISWSQPQQWRDHWMFVFRLLDSYLREGRERSKAWSPTSWLRACVELPSVSFPFQPKSASQNLSASYMRSVLLVSGTTFSNRGGARPARLRTDLLAMFGKGPQSLRALKEFVESLSDFILSLMVATSMSIAVFNNSRTGGVSGGTDHSGRLALLSRVFDMHERLETSLVVMKAVAGKVVNSKAADGETIRRLVVEITTELEDFLQSVFSTSVLFDEHALWEVAFSGVDGRLVDDARMRHVESRTSALLLRLDSNRETSTIATPQQFSLLVRRGQHILLDCSQATSGSATAQLSETLTEALSIFGLIGQVLSRASSMPETNEVLSIQTCLVILNEGGYRSEGPSENTLSSLARGVTEQVLTTLEDTHYFVVADMLLEIMSTYVLGDVSFMLQVADICFKCLHTIFSDPIPLFVGELPTPFALESLLNDPVKRTMRSRLKPFLESKLRSDQGNPPYSNLSVFRRVLLRHFALTVTLENPIHIYDNHVGYMVEEVSLLLADFQAKVHESETGKRRAGLSTMPLLDGTTFEDILQLILDYTVAATAICGPASADATLRNRLGPYTSLHILLETFSRALRLYESHLSLFTRKYASVIFRISRHMVDVLPSQLRRCSDWRNHQPLPSRTARQSYDPGAVIHLDELFAKVASRVYGTMSKVCDCWQDNIPESAPVSRMTTLIEKGLRTLRDMAVSHNLAPPSIELDIDDEERPRSFPPVEGFHVSQKKQRPTTAPPPIEPMDLVDTDNESDSIADDDTSQSSEDSGAMLLAPSLKFCE